MTGMIPAHVEPIAFEGPDAIALLGLLASVGLAIYLYRRNR